MLYKTIVVPYDNSESAHAALLEAMKIASIDFDSNVRILHIVDTEQRVIDKLEEKSGMPDAPKPSSEALRALFDEVIREADAELHDRIDPVIAAGGNRVSIDIVEETLPGDQIVAYAKEHGADLVIMGSRGLGALRGILGSVSNHVLRTAPMPVMIVKQ
ncbi:universal stress protein [Raoultibacter massiliensis]|uniref:Universal stress protein n=1 Tax=Raoultibacter massiliensis TaxID=1852371 RepID=A0ABV1JE20_9ACTN|nr:universal stress protein [Raoultibacter massiliensis]